MKFLISFLYVYIFIFLSMEISFCTETMYDMVHNYFVFTFPLPPGSHLLFEWIPEDCEYMRWRPYNISEAGIQDWVNRHPNLAYSEICPTCGPPYSKEHFDSLHWYQRNQGPIFHFLFYQFWPIWKIAVMHNFFWAFFFNIWF